MSNVQSSRFYVGEDIKSVGRAVENLQEYSTEQDVVRVTADYQILPQDDLVLVDTTGGNVVVTLPAIADAQLKLYYVKRITAGANTLTVDGHGAETIDGAANALLPNQYDVVALLPERQTTIVVPVRTWWIV